MPFDLSRRALVTGAAAMLPTLAFAQGKPPAPGTSVLTGRVYGPDAPPINYPDPDVLIVSPEGARCFIGHSNIKRIGTGMVWATSAISEPSTTTVSTLRNSATLTIVSE